MGNPTIPRDFRHSDRKLCFSDSVLVWRIVVSVHLPNPSRIKLKL
jgi:hypothetical protein